MDNDSKDATATILASVLSKRDDVEVLDLSTFLTRSGVVFDPELGDINVSDQPQAKETVGDHNRKVRIYNRVVRISAATTSALDGGRRVVAAGSVLSAYGKILSEYDEVWGRPGLYSAVGNSVPLNLQWRLFGERVPHIKTPRFVYAFGAQRVDVSDFERPVWKSPFDLYGWIPSAELNLPVFHTFVVERPLGEPVVLYFAGDALALFAVDRSYIISPSATKDISRVADDIRDIFKAFMGEALFFVNGDDITFAAFSHYLNSSINQPEFSATIETGLLGAVAN